ncbi:hypothetical protein OYC64_012942 [Pagothenia borchgrevinki]|uniref:Integrin alpha third immunoglobulin-like domain-containing protein n=1 Tax=Pagothenia borchgrevinki TaxID=8213 RepID=A0ABD2FSM8_PAGBO
MFGMKGWHEPSSKRREAELEALSIDGLSFLSKKRKYKTLTCSDGLKCVELRCPLLGLDSTAVIVLNSRLWNTIFTERGYMSCLAHSKKPSHEKDPNTETAPLKA